MAYELLTALHDTFTSWASTDADTDDGGFGAPQMRGTIVTIELGVLVPRAFTAATRN